MARLPVVLSEGAFVEIEGDWRLYIAKGDPVLRGIFAVNGHDYFGDGRPLTRGAPRICSVSAQ